MRPDLLAAKWTVVPHQTAAMPTRPVTLTSPGQVVTGEVRLERETEIRGRFGQDRIAGGAIGFNQLTGQFSRDAFEGAFERSTAPWKCC